MIEGLKPYPKYKESGLPWVFRTPGHWSINRLRHVCDMIVSNVDKNTKENELAVRLCNYVDVYRNERIHSHLRFMRATASENEVECFRLHHGDVVITKDSEEWTDIGVPSLIEYEAPDFICGYHLAILRSRPNYVVGAFLHRALQCHLIAAQFHVEAHGVTRYGLGHGAIKDVIVPIPPLDEQAAIVRFLDHANRKIDVFIRAKRKLIGLLNEQKQAIIHRAVTRGLNPDVPLKPSGIPWLGDIPEHWETMRLKNACRIRGGFSFKTEYFRADGIPVIRMSNLRRGTLDLRDAVRISPPDCMVGFELQQDDILYGLSGSVGITGSLGNYAVVRSGDLPAQLNQRVARFRPDVRILSVRFLVFLIQTSTFYDQVLTDTNGTAQFNVSTIDIGKVTFSLPSVFEQDKICDWLDNVISRPNELITRTEREIALMQEYRTRLTSDIVTGKLDVREAAAKLPEIPTDASMDTDDDESLEELESEESHE